MVVSKVDVDEVFKNFLLYYSSLGLCLIASKNNKSAIEI